MNEDKFISIGEKSPQFSLTDQNTNIFNISDFKGKRILLSFHPLAWTAVCAKQMQSLEENFEKFEKLNTVAVGINIDSVPSKKAWADSLNIKKIRLLSDFWPHGKVARLFGIFREKDGFSQRANIIIDENQNICFVKIYEIGTLPDIDEILKFLKKN